MIALGFVRHPSSMAGKMTPLDEDWLSDSTAKWAIDVNGEMISVTAHLHPPYLPIIQQESLSFIYTFKHFIISSIFFYQGQLTVKGSSNQMLPRF
jgi:hypothetical protein